MMEKLIEQFPNHLRQALKLVEALDMPWTGESFQSVYIAGVGGSAIGGDIVRDIIRTTCSLPVITGRSYEIPAFVGEKTLFIAVSYSGNTEETLSALAEAKSRNAYRLCISSGGKLVNEGNEDRQLVVRLPEGEMIPRAQLAFPLVHLLGVFVKLGLVSNDILQHVSSASDLLKFDQDDIKKRAMIMAEGLHGKLPLIYTSSRMESVAVRFRQQINENAKCLGWHQVVPEMNHNELVGWRDQYPHIAVVYLRNKDDFRRNAIRMDINKDIIGKYAGTILELYSKGHSLTEKMLYFIHLCDWTSLYLAQLKGMDPVEIDVINFLKSELGKVR